MPSSIEDVAKRANVSISTVSRVINRRELVNEETCKRVEAAIRELKYRPNAFARGLMLRKSGIVGPGAPRSARRVLFGSYSRGESAGPRDGAQSTAFVGAFPAMMHRAGWRRWGSTPCWTDWR